MKKFKRAAALCLSLVTAAVSVPAFTVLAEPDSSEPAAETTVSGDLPKSFDLRQKGLTSAVGDEMHYNTSWAFAATNSMESGLIQNIPTIDLSEWSMAYYMFSDFAYPYNTDVPFNAGVTSGDRITGFLTGWYAPARSEFTYSYGDLSIMDAQYTADDARLDAAYHVTDAVKYASPAHLCDENGNYSNDAVKAQEAVLKERIYSGKALAMCLAYADVCYNAKTDAYCYNYEHVEKNGSEDNIELRWLSIVGWDDDFPASSFTTDPGVNGAWLCKDCRGTSYGDNGFIWVSYADFSVADILELRTEDAHVNNRLYQHDDLGTNLLYAIDSKNGDKAVYIANVFEAEQNGWITGLMYFNHCAGDVFEATVYTGLTSGDNPVSGTAAGTQKAVLDEEGYLTIELDEPVYLKKGEKFSVTAKVSGETATYRIPCEYASRMTSTASDGTKKVYDSSFSMDMLLRDFRSGQSFYSADGDVWVDMYNVAPEKWSNTGKTDSTEDATASQDLPTETLPTFIPPTIETTEPPVVLATDVPAVSSAQDPEEPVLAEMPLKGTAGLYLLADGEESAVSPDPDLPEDTEKEEISRYGNICLKAITCDCGTVRFSNYSGRLAEGEKLTLSCIDNVPIYYTLDGVNWELYDTDKAITLPEGEDSLILTAYADLSLISLSDDKRLYTECYTRKSAEVSSLLCKSDADAVAKYADRDSSDPGCSYTYYVPKNATSIEIMPNAAGSVTIGDTACKSGEKVTVPLAADTKSVTIKVTEEGAKDAEFALNIKRLDSESVIPQETTEPQESTEPQETTEPQTERKLGDVNGDGKINSSDGTMILIAAAHIGGGDPTGGLTEEQRKAADVNGDGKINSVDATSIFRYSAAYANNSEVKLTDFT